MFRIFHLNYSRNKGLNMTSNYYYLLQNKLNKKNHSIGKEEEKAKGFNIN